MLYSLISHFPRIKTFHETEILDDDVSKMYPLNKNGY